MIVLYRDQQGKTSNMEFADLEIGCMGQNLYLQAASLGLDPHLRGSRQRPRLEGLGLKENRYSGSPAVGDGNRERPPLFCWRLVPPQFRGEGKWPCLLSLSISASGRGSGSSVAG